MVLFHQVHEHVQQLQELEGEAVEPMRVHEVQAHDVEGDYKNDHQGGHSDAEEMRVHQVQTYEVDGDYKGDHRGGHNDAEDSLKA